MAEAPAPAVYGILLDNGGDLSGFLGTDPAALAYVPVDTGVAALAAQMGQRDSGVLVGVIDSGVNTRHPQIAAVLVEARAFAGDSAEDELGHGTAVAIAAAAGVHRLLSARVTDRTHRPRLDAVLAAIDWLGEAGARTINLSLGFATDVPGADRLCAAVDRWTDRGVLFVAAAGNEGPDVPRLPAACPGGRVLAVASDEPTSGVGDVRAPRAARTDYAGHLGALGRAAIAAAEAGRRAEAEAGLAVIAAEARRSGLGVAHGVKGAVAHALGDRAAAFAAWGRMAEAIPADPAPRHNRALLLFEAGEPAAAAAELARALAVAPHDPAALWFEAVIRANLGDRAATLAALDRLLAVAPDHPDAAGLRAALAADDRPPAEVLRRHFQREP